MDSRLTEDFSPRDRKEDEKRASAGREGKVRIMNAKSRALAPGPFFATRCETTLQNDALFPANGLAVAVGQMIQQDGRQKIWDSILLLCEEEKDGTLAIRVIVSNPDWDGPLQIACTRSRPQDSESMTPLACNLDHKKMLD